MSAYQHNSDHDPYTHPKLVSSSSSTQQN